MSSAKGEARTSDPFFAWLRRSDTTPSPRRDRARQSSTTRRAPLWRSFGVQLGALYLTLFLGSLALLFVLADLATRRTLEARDVDALTSELSRQGDRLEADGLAGLAPNVFAGRARFVRVSTVDNRTLFRGGTARAPGDHALALPPGAIEPVLMRVTHARTVWTVVASRTGDGRVLQVGMSDEGRQALLSDLRTGYLGVLGTAAILGLLAGAWLTRRTLRPIRALAATTRRVIDDGDLSARVPRRQTDDELDRLAALYNEMLAKSERLVTGMREALDHVAHDLRTPLTRLRSGAEVGLRSDDPDAPREALADSIEECDRVLTMLRSLMDISEAEAGVMRLARSRVALVDVAQDVRDLYEHVAEEAGVTLSVRAEEDVFVDADPVRVRQAVANLVDNAIKYSRAGGRVSIEALRANGAAILRVADDGVGIPAEALPRIWDRLYRVDPSRAERGLGLGLSLVKAIAEAHGGEARVASAPGRGSTFELRLPAS